MSLGTYGRAPNTEPQALKAKRGTLNVLLLSTYELGHQPLGLARPAAHLMAAGHAVVCTDLAVEPLNEDAVLWADFIGISVPMHTATRLALPLATRVRALNRSAHLCFYGLYASLNDESLLSRYADSVIGGEYETPLVDLVDLISLSISAPTPASANGGAAPVPAGVSTLDNQGEVHLGRQQFAMPYRQLLPPLERYAQLDDGTRRKLAGYVEASRGCAHRCLHCPITPVYQGRLRVVQQDAVLNDIRQLAAMGAEHITFGDPDFFNGIKHSCRLVEAMQAELPTLTYDVTIKVEHLLEHRALLPFLKQSGCLFVVSAVESVDDQVLTYLQKGHTAADVGEALDLMASVNLPLRPTFVAFTPWTTLQSYVGLLDFVERRGLIHHIDPVQLAIRLLVPRGSSLVGTPALEPHLGRFDETAFTYSWRHPDPRVDALQTEVAAAVEQAARTKEDAFTTFYRVKNLALAAHTGTVVPSRIPPKRATAGRPPRLTEPWFC